MGYNGIKQDEIETNGMEYKWMHEIIMEWNRMEYNGLKWDGKERNGME